MNKKLIILFLCSFSILVAFHPVKILEVRFNEYHFFLPLAHSLFLSVEYTHSVSLTKVVDVYKINGSGIYAIETKWQDFEAGQPLNGKLKGKFYVKKLNRYLGKEWEYWFVSVNNFTLKVDGRVLHQPKEDGTLEFKVREVPALKLLTR